jgi:hypothetical protein
LPYGRLIRKLLPLACDLVALILILVFVFILRLFLSLILWR